MRNLSSSLLALALLTSSTAFAAPNDLDRRLDELTRAEPTAYVKARDAIVGDRSVSDAALGERVSRSRWTAETWRSDAMALIVDTRRREPRAFDALSALKGLDPSVYLQNRKAVPLAGRELSHADVSPAVLLEGVLFGDAVRVSHPMPAHVEKPRASASRRAETRAFKDALFMALSSSGHASAVPALLDVGVTASDPADRGGALALVGALHADPRVESTLVLVVEDSALPEDARVGAVIGLGKVRSLRAVELLAAVSAHDENLAVKRSAVGALGNAGNRAAHRVIKSKEAPLARARAIDALVDVVLRSTDDVSREMTVQALAVSGDAATHARLVDVAASTKDARAKELLEQSARVLAKGLARESKTR